MKSGDRFKMAFKVGFATHHLVFTTLVAVSLFDYDRTIFLGVRLRLEHLVFINGNKPLVDQM